jgi:TonB family protein
MCRKFRLANLLIELSTFLLGVAVAKLFVATTIGEVDKRAPRLLDVSARVQSEKEENGSSQGCTGESGEPNYKRWGPPLSPGRGSGGMSGADTGIGPATSGRNGETVSSVPIVPDKKNVVPYKILSKPRPSYTPEARACNYQGSVRLKVVLLARGNVGSVTPLTELPYGLTEQAVAAARQIRFEPKKVNGVPQSISVTIEYNFTIY